MQKKMENEERIKEAKKTTEELQKEYDKSIESQTSNIKKTGKYITIVKRRI